MKLSDNFSIDPQTPWVVKHNKEAREVMEAFRDDKPIRVPLIGDYSVHFYAYNNGIDFKGYYSDPDKMIKMQLEANRWVRELPISDMILCEPPESWFIMVDFWPVVGPGWLGAELLHRDTSNIANHRFDLSKEECDRMEMPDPVNGGILKDSMRFWKYMKENYEGNNNLGRPIGPIWPGVGTNGVFCTVLDLRGPDIMADMYEDPDFAHRFINKIADWCYILENTWSRISNGEKPEDIELPAHAPVNSAADMALYISTGKPLEFPGDAPVGWGPTDHGIDMLSPWLYEEFIIPMIMRMNRLSGTRPHAFLHHCGRGVQLFPVMHKHFKLERIENLTHPMVDIAKVRRELGEEIWIHALFEDGIVQEGPPERIRQMVKDLLTSGAKGKGRLSIGTGDMLRGTPLEHRIALYEAVKEFGTY